MSTSDCPQKMMVEALHDGRLGAQERASVERHVALCPECTEAARQLRAIGDALREPLGTLSPLEHQRARNALLRRAADQPAIPRPGRGYPSFAIAASLAVAMVIGWMGARAFGPAAHVEVAAHLPPVPSRLGLRETNVRSSEGARFERATSGALDVVTLTSGALDVTVRALAPGEHFLVKTSDAVIEVKSTSFHVEADKGKIRRVAVADGSVEVRYAGFSAVIPSGGSWQATVDDATPAPAATTAAAPIPTATAAVVADATPPPSKPALKLAAVAARETRAPKDPPPAPTAAETAAPAAPSAVPVSPASQEFAQAMTAMAHGDFAGSARQMESFSAAHPDDARSDEAEYLRAIALERAGRTADARAAAKRYLASRPAGAHRSEAKKIAGE